MQPDQGKAAIPKVDALTALLILTIEPVLAPVWAFASLGEMPTWLALLGMGMVMAGSLAEG